MVKVQSSYITLRNLRFHARHGVMPQERVTGGDFTVTLRVKCNMAKAAETDNVDDTINYAALFQLVREEMIQPSKLMEHVAGRIGRRIFAEFNLAEEVQIHLTKMNPPMGADGDGATVEFIFNK